MAASEGDAQDIGSTKPARLAAELSGMQVKKRTSEEIKVDLTPVFGGVRDNRYFNYYIRLVRKQPLGVFAVRRHHLPQGFLPRSLRQHGDVGVREGDVDDFLHDLWRVCHCAALKLAQYRQIMKENPRVPFLHKSVRILGVNTVQFKLACVDDGDLVSVTFTLGYKWTGVRPARLNLSSSHARRAFLESLREATLQVFQTMPLRNAVEYIASCSQSP